MGGTWDTVLILTAIFRGVILREEDDMTGNLINMKEMVENRVKQTENISGEKNGKPGSQGKKTGGSGSGIDSNFIMDCLNKNELGDGELFKKLSGDKLICNP